MVPSYRLDAIIDRLLRKLHHNASFRITPPINTVLFSKVGEEVLVVPDPLKKPCDPRLYRYSWFPVQFALCFTDIADVDALITRPPIAPNNRNWTAQQSLQQGSKFSPD